MLTVIHSIGATPEPQLRPLPASVAFALMVTIGIALLAGSSALTPLYAVYQAAWGYSSLTTTVIFAVYAIAVLTALLTVGSLSDHLGRRPVLITGLLAQAAIMVLFAQAGGVAWLVVGRILQGLSTGAIIGTVGATLIDLNRSRGTIANAVSGMAGTATGAIVSGWFVHALPAPTQLIFTVFVFIFLVQAVGVGLMAETSAPRPGAWAAVRPRLALPSGLRAPFWAVAPVLVAGWALAGFYGSLGPALARHLVASPSALIGGLTLGLLATGGVVSVLILHRRNARTLMLLGTTALLAGVGIAETSLALASWRLFLSGTLLAGAGFGAGFQGAIRTVLPLAEAHQRAGVLSVIYVVSYLAMGLPAVLAGYISVHAGGVVVTAEGYGVAIMILAGLALLRTALPGRPAPAIVHATVPAAVPAARISSDRAAGVGPACMRAACAAREAALRAAESLGREQRLETVS